MERGDVEVRVQQIDTACARPADGPKAQVGLERRVARQDGVRIVRRNVLDRTLSSRYQLAEKRLRIIGLPLFHVVDDAAEVGHSTYRAIKLCVEPGRSAQSEGLQSGSELSE